MTPILFYGVPSGCSFGSIVALEWSGLPYRLCRIDMPAQVMSDAYARINPVRETPSLMTADGRLISESVAILHHIAAQGGPAAVRQGEAGFDRLNQMLGYLNTSFFNAFAPLWHALEHGAEGPEKDALRHYGAGKVRRAHQQLQAMLGDQPWLLGQERSLADAYFSGLARWTAYHDVLDRKKDYPSLERLFNQLEADPAVQFAHVVEKQGAALEQVGAGGYQGHLTLEEALRLLP